MRERSSVVLIQNNKVGLIKRDWNESVYYVFPGGGIEPGETPESAAEREALEEVGVEVEIQKHLATVEFNGNQYFFQAKIIGGEFGVGQGEEYVDPTRDRGTYLPVWIALNNLNALDVRPKEVAIIIQNSERRNRK